MSRNTDLVPNRTVIVAPVSVHDVAKTIHRSSLDVGTLCTAKTYINMWAKYKPVRYQYLDTVTGQWNATAKRWKTASEMSAEERTKGSWWLAGGGCGIKTYPVTGASANIKNMCATWLASGWRAFWEYQTPRGSSVTPNEPYRLTDFANYVHSDARGDDYDKPWQDWDIGGSEITLWDYKNADNPQVGTSSAQGNIREPAKISDYHLSLADIRQAFAAANISLADTYFGVIVAYYPSSGNPEFSILTSKYKWSDVVPSDSSDGHPAGTDVRRTPLLKNHMFKYNDREFKVFPILSTVKFENSDTAGTGNRSWLQESNGTFALGSDWILPMPLNPITVRTKTPEAYGIYSLVSATASANSNTVRFNISIKNTSTQNKLNMQTQQFLFQVLVSDSNRIPLWDSGRLKFTNYGTISKSELAVGETVTSTGTISHTLDRGNGNFITGDIIHVYIYIDTSVDIATNDRVDLGNNHIEIVV